MNLMARRRALMRAKKGGGLIWLFDNGVIGSDAGGFEAKGPNGGATITTSIDDTVFFSLAQYNGGHAISTLVTQNTVSAQGQKLHIRILTKCSDNRARLCWFFAYASQTVTDASDIPSTGSEISQYFPNGDGTTFRIPYNNTAELETELVIPITQNNTFVSVGVLKHYLYVQYAKVTQMWIE